MRLIFLIVGFVVIAGGACRGKSNVLRREMQLQEKAEARRGREADEVAARQVEIETVEALEDGERLTLELAAARTRRRDLSEQLADELRTLVAIEEDIAAVAAKTERANARLVELNDLEQRLGQSDSRVAELRKEIAARAAEREKLLLDLEKMQEQVEDLHARAEARTAVLGPRLEALRAALAESESKPLEKASKPAGIKEK